MKLNLLENTISPMCSTVTAGVDDGGSWIERTSRSVQGDLKLLAYLQVMTDRQLVADVEAKLYLLLFSHFSFQRGQDTVSIFLTFGTRLLLFVTLTPSTREKT